MVPKRPRTPREPLPRAIIIKISDYFLHHSSEIRQVSTILFHLNFLLMNVSRTEHAQVDEVNYIWELLGVGVGVEVSFFNNVFFL